MVKIFKIVAGLALMISMPCAVLQAMEDESKDRHAKRVRTDDENPQSKQQKKRQGESAGCKKSAQLGTVTRVVGIPQQGRTAMGEQGEHAQAPQPTDYSRALARQGQESRAGDQNGSLRRKRRSHMLVEDDSACESGERIPQTLGGTEQVQPTKPQARPENGAEALKKQKAEAELRAAAVARAINEIKSRAEELLRDTEFAKSQKGQQFQLNMSQSNKVIALQVFLNQAVRDADIYAKQRIAINNIISRFIKGPSKEGMVTEGFEYHYFSLMDHQILLSGIKETAEGVIYRRADENQHILRSNLARIPELKAAWLKYMHDLIDLAFCQEFKNQLVNEDQSFKDQFTKTCQDTIVDLNKIKAEDYFALVDRFSEAILSKEGYTYFRITEKGESSLNMIFASAKVFEGTLPVNTIQNVPFVTGEPVNPDRVQLLNNIRSVASSIRYSDEILKTIRSQTIGAQSVGIARPFDLIAEIAQADKKPIQSVSELFSKVLLHAYDVRLDSEAINKGEIIACALGTTAAGKPELRVQIAAQVQLAGCICDVTYRGRRDQHSIKDTMCMIDILISIPLTQPCTAKTFDLKYCCPSTKWEVFHRNLLPIAASFNQQGSQCTTFITGWLNVDLADRFPACTNRAAVCSPSNWKASAASVASASFMAVVRRPCGCC